MGRRRGNPARALLTLGLTIAIAGAVPSPAAAADVAPPSFADGQGLRVASAERKGPRLFEVTLTTDLLTAPAKLSILLPESYDASASRRYPVLYLFHGTSGRAADWTTQGDATATTAGRDLIVVMPDAGVDGDGGSWFTDWHNGGAGGPPKWETFHVERLIPWIDAQLRTVAERRGRAIAGLSQGGFGAMSYAARHPELFVAAAAYSAPLDISANPEIAVPIITPIVNATEVGLNGVPPNTFFGDRLTNEVNWAAHDPATLASNLRGMRLFAYTGNGQPGPFDPPVPNPGGAVIEAGAAQLTELFHGELVERGIPIAYHAYGGGTHSWPYWARDLRDMIDPLMRIFGDPDPAPARVDYTSTDARYAQWGWDVAMDRPVREFSGLQGAAADGFALAGSGAGTVTTPPFYEPGSTASLTLDGPTVREARTAKVGGDGRLRVEVPLGPVNGAQQYTPGSVTAVHTTRVAIRAPRVCASRRVLDVTVRMPRGTRPGAVSARVPGRTLTARRRAGKVRVSLAGLPRGRYRVTVVARGTLRGKAVRRTTTRTVRTCGAA